MTLIKTGISVSEFLILGGVRVAPLPDLNNKTVSMD
jgi:hypothetical protein